MDPIALVLSSWPGVAPVADFVRAGVSQHQLERTTRRGEIHRVRRGWYAGASAPDAVVRAVRAGGALTSTSAARLFGLWVPPDDRLHVSLARNSMGALPRMAGDDVCVHWRREAGPTVRAVEPLVEVLRQAVECLPEEMAVVLIDSALNKRAMGITLADLECNFAPLAQRYQRALAKADGASDSGIETLTRLRLRSRGIRVRTQVHISRVGFVDLVVGDRLVIETEGVRPMTRPKGSSPTGNGIWSSSLRGTSECG